MKNFVGLVMLLVLATFASAGTFIVVDDEGIPQAGINFVYGGPHVPFTYGITDANGHFSTPATFDGYVYVVVNYKFGPYKSYYTPIYTTLTPGYFDQEDDGVVLGLIDS